MVHIRSYLKMDAIPALSLTKQAFEIKYIPPTKRHAEVAELADALRSGRSESNLMRVQVPPSAQKARLFAGLFL